MADEGDRVRGEYERRREERRARAAHAKAAADRISNARLAVFVAGLAVAWGVFGDGRLPGWTLAPPALGFAALVVVHDRLLRRAGAAERAADWYDDGLARLDARFAGRGSAGERFRDPDHPYAEDLDLFGPGSLFELL
ncbi:MAG TPA: DNA mismatch repair protein MutS, partial [Myxococcota bacterium]